MFENTGEGDSSSSSAHADTSTNKSSQLRSDPKMCTSASLRSKVTGRVFEVSEKIEPQTEPVAEREYSEEKSGKSN